MKTLQPKRFVQVEWNMEKAMRPTALAFFLCLLASTATAQSNWVLGSAYGTNDLSTATSISSEKDDIGSLIIGFGGTTNITLNNTVDGFILVTNNAPSFTINGGTNTLTTADFAVLAFAGSSNAIITGGRFIGTTGAGGNFPPIPGQNVSGSDTAAIGGLAVNSAITINGSEFAGANGLEAFIAENSVITVNDGLFRGGNGATALLATSTSTVEIVDGIFVGGANGGIALAAGDHSDVTIHGGSFTGGVGQTAFYLQNSDAIVSNGTFVGNGGGSIEVSGQGLFSELTETTTNQITLVGGTFDSIAFYGINGSMQNLFLGSNLTVNGKMEQVGGSLAIDNFNDDALSQLEVFDGSLTLGNDYTLPEGGKLGLYRSRLDALGAVAFSSNSVFEIEIASSNSPVVTAGTATFQTNSSMKLTVFSTALGAETNTIEIVRTSGGIFLASTSATTDSFTNNVLVDIQTDWLVTPLGLSIDGNALELDAISEKWGIAWIPGTKENALGNELYDLASDSPMATIVSALGEDAFKSVTETTYWTTFNTMQSALQSLRAAVGPVQSRGTEFRELIKLIPPGARGPARWNEFRGWGKYYGHFINQSKEGLNPAYDTTLHGGVAGIDRSFASMLVGISGGAGAWSSTYDNDAEETATSYHGTLYTTWAGDHAYLDAGITYSHSQIETETAEPFVLKGEFDTQVMSGYIGAGYDFSDTKGNTVFTPEIAVQYAQYEQDEYAETGRIAVPREFDEFDADSLMTTLGLNISMIEQMKLETFGFKLDSRFHWIREFNPEPGDIGFGLVDGNNTYIFAHPVLQEDLFRAGFGATLFNTRNKPQNVMLRIDFDELFGDGFNSHNLSAKVIYAF